MRNLRYRIILKYVGGALWVLTGEFILVALAALILGEWHCIPIYLLCALGTGFAGWLLVRTVPEKEITVPEAMSVAALIFLVASIVGGIPFFCFGPMTPLDAWFDSMSAYTTTGFSLMDVAAAPLSLLFFRALSQWLGGLGFVLFTIGLLLGSSGFSAEAALTLLGEGEREEKFLPRISSYVKLISITYASLTLIAIAVLLLTGAGLFDAICYSLSGISTGGFATHPGSAADLGAAIWGLVFVMWMGSISFLLYSRTWVVRKSRQRLLRGLFGDPQLLCIFLFTIFGALAIYLSRGEEGGFRDAFFFAASAVSTTGYSASNTSLLPAFPMALLVVLMFVGGSMGSSAGGVKILRLVELFRGIHEFMLSHIYAKEVVRKKGIENDALIDILMVIAFYAITVVIGSLVFVVCGYDPLRSLFEVTSAVSTVGLSSGIVSHSMSGGLKALMILLMWAGRVEFIPIMVWSYSMAVRRR